jgi:ATP-dependent exoDNAse (exonuclease V) beta subunit
MKSVTLLLQILNKPTLLNWSNKIGLQGISLKAYRSKLQSGGTNIHSQIENYLKTKQPFEYADKLDLILTDFEVIGIEKDINNGYICGRIDLILSKNGKTFVCDFKSSNKIYLEQKIQLSTYKEIYGADYIAIINFTDWKLNILNIRTDEYYKIIKHLYSIKQLTDKLNEVILK